MVLRLGRNGLIAKLNNMPDKVEDIKKDEVVEVQVEHPVVGLWKYVHNLEARIKLLENKKK